MNEQTNTLDTLKAHASDLAKKAGDAKVEANVKVGEHEVSYTKGEQDKADQRHPMEKDKTDHRPL